MQPEAKKAPPRPRRKRAELPPDGGGEAKPSAPWKGRKRAEADAKDKRIAIRLSAADHDLVEARAKEAGLAIGAYMRKATLGSAGARHKRQAKANPAAVAKVLSELGKIGSNVNQIAKWSNTMKMTPILATVRGMQRDLAVMRDQLTEALGYDNPQR